MGKNLTKFFESYLEKDFIFADKSALQANFTPDNIEHRDEQVQQLADILAPALKNHKPSNIFIYGKTGTGKTLTVTSITNQMNTIAATKNIPLRICYINCKLKRVADTEYRLIAELARQFNKTIPATGLPTDEVYKIFYDALEKEEKVVLLILDEVDQLVAKCGDEILYNLTRIGSSIQKSKVSIIGISNDLLFTDNLDPRVISSLNEEEIVFPPYNANQIRSILTARAAKAFKEGVIESGVVAKCAAFTAKEHGDVRRAIELLRIAGELAEREQKKVVTIANLDHAESKIERDKVTTLVSTQPKQHQIVLYSILAVQHDKKKAVLTGEVYDFYTQICGRAGHRPLTQRRVSDIIGEFDMLGLINASVISKGRFGRTREITISVPEQVRPKVLEILEQSVGV